MRVLALDPGAERMGYAILERPEDDKNKPCRRIGSGFLGIKRDSNESEKEAYQQYRLRLIDYWIAETPTLLNSFTPDVVVSEIVPVVGGGNFVVATQSQLASTAITVVQAVARQRGLKVEQLGATTVKAKIGGRKKATKVQVRNGVFKLLPGSEVFKKQWTVLFDESDAHAIGLTYLGYKI